MRRIAALLIATAALAGPAAAQIAVGATVKDTAGGTVGTVTAFEGGNVTVDTGKNKVAIPETSFAKTPDGPLLGMTKDQLDTAVESAAAESKARLMAAIVPGADVLGSAGSVIGKIEKVEGELVMLTSAAGSANVPISGLALRPDGLHFGMTAEEFTAAVAAAKASTGR
jgi:hypothetical protein